MIINGFNVILFVLLQLSLCKIYLISYSKKQKVSGAFSDQSIEQLNDVTAVSGVNLRVCYSPIFSSAYCKV